MRPTTAGDPRSPHPHLTESLSIPRQSVAVVVDDLELDEVGRLHEDRAAVPQGHHAGFLALDPLGGITHAIGIGLDLLSQALAKEKSTYRHAIAAVRAMLPPPQPGDIAAIAPGRCTMPRSMPPGPSVDRRAGPG